MPRQSARLTTEITNKLTDPEKIERVADRNAWTYEEAYSGREMFGRRCPAIVCDHWEIKAAMGKVKRAGIKDVATWDQLGKHVVVYWPTVPSDVPAEVAAYAEAAGGQ